MISTKRRRKNEKESIRLDGNDDNDEGNIKDVDIDDNEIKEGEMKRFACLGDSLLCYVFILCIYNFIGL